MTKMGTDPNFCPVEKWGLSPFHIILEVTDSGSPRLYSYRRLIFTVTP
jgi:hypothetical protein